MNNLHMKTLKIKICISKYTYIEIMLYVTCKFTKFYLVQFFVNTGEYLKQSLVTIIDEKIK